MSLMRERYKKKFGATDKQIDNMLNMIGYVESKNKNIAQDSGGGKIGPGRGYFQFEATAKDKEGKFAQGSAVTALKRVKNVYRESGMEIPDWAKRNLEKDYEDPTIGFDVMSLNREQQEEMVLADLYIKSGGSFANKEKDKLSQPVLEKALQGDVKELWLKHHWAGAKPGSDEYQKKSEQWNREMDSLIFDKMEKATS
tara:strand:+ start:321 stop:914 length:594 start_codon:yes stop_codon:yes gene_type:complete